MDKSERNLISEEELCLYTHALGVVDMSTMDENKDVDILHAALYQEQPNDKDKSNLLKEMKDDETFGLSRIAERLTVVELPDFYVQSMIKDIKDDN